MKALRLAAIGVAVLMLSAYVGTPAAHSNDTKVRWDIVSIDFSTNTASAGGPASALANDGSKITVTGSGTFAPGEEDEVTGGGNWTARDASNNTTGSGTYKVTGLVRFDLAPGTFPSGNTDEIGNPLDVRAGLLVVAISYSEGSKGVVTVSCHLVGTPDSVFEGVTASKGFVDYWNPQPPS